MCVHVPYMYVCMYGDIHTYKHLSWGNGEKRRSVIVKSNFVMQTNWEFYYSYQFTLHSNLLFGVWSWLTLVSSGLSSPPQGSHMHPSILTRKRPVLLLHGSCFGVRRFLPQDRKKFRPAMDCRDRKGVRRPSPSPSPLSRWH
jgi:hypothetical protein